MSSDKINIDKLAETVTKSLDDYVTNVNSGMDNAIEDTADQIVKDISANAPRRTGKYASSWDTIKAVWDTVSDFFQGIWDAVAKPVEDIWNGIKDTFNNSIQWIKDLFNFEWHWPSIPLPHFSMSPANWQVIDMFSGSFPSIGIDWYDKGGIFNSPSVIGVGEKRPEFVGALDDLRQIVREENKSTPAMTINMTVNPSQGMDEKQIADYAIERLQFMVNKKNNAF